jgi:hypothetical protein
VTRARQLLPVASRAPARGWTYFDQLVSMLKKRWDTGRYLRAYAASEPWEPFALPIKGPTAPEFLDHFDAARRWATDFERDAGAHVDADRLSIEYRTVQGRNLGANRIPARIRIDSFHRLCDLLGTSGEVRALDHLTSQTCDRIPLLSPWVAEHPLVALGYRGVWDKVLAIVEWIVVHDTRGLYLRQLDVEGVDTKFIERHQKVLDELLTTVLPPDRVNLSYPRGDFTRRFGFLAKPGYTRFRLLNQDRSGFPSGVTELTMRTDELAELAPDITTVFVVENEVTYLAFPEVADSIVVFGSGFALTALSALPWLQGKQIVYWGDIDTHGFDILSRLRGRFSAVRSMLMDSDTLLAHANQWVTEPSPTRRALAYLTAEEASVYRDLVEGAHGPTVRLEQERVRFSALDRALLPWRSTMPN